MSIPGAGVPACSQDAAWQGFSLRPESGLDRSSRLLTVVNPVGAARADRSAAAKAPASLLATIASPRDLDGLTPTQLETLAAEIRTFLIEHVSKSGGHLGPNLGVVELTIALHSVFNSPRDAILWDTGHQTYVHKILTGRADRFDTLRHLDGLSGYPSRSESEHDIIEHSHASSALSYGDGIAKAWELSGELSKGGSDGRHVVAVVGDGALTGGMAWEALNNIACSNRQVIIVVNDNARSYAPTIGGMAEHLASLRTNVGYEKALRWGKRVLTRTPVVGRSAYGALHGMKKGVKDIVSPQGLFEDLGLKYLGPVDGHDVEALQQALNLARGYPGPVLVHALTEKGRGYAPAEAHDGDRFHGIGVIDPETGESMAASKRSWTEVFSDEMVRVGASHPEVVAITAAMLDPVGLSAFAKRFPDRVFDVGIAEQHAMASAAGMAFAGLHPVVALYSTFLSRAFDQLLFDAASHRAGMTIVLDRAGITGEDGASHHGMWDLSLSGIVPGLRVAAPRDARALVRQLREAIAIVDRPTLVRFPKGAVPEPIEAVQSVGRIEVLVAADRPDVLLVSIGAMAPLCMEVASRLATLGVRTAVVDPGWVLPVQVELVGLGAASGLVVTVEDNCRSGGVASHMSQALRDADVDVPCRDFGLPFEFIEHGSREQLLARVGLTADKLTCDIVDVLRAQTEPAPAPVAKPVAKPTGGQD